MSQSITYNWSKDLLAPASYKIIQQTAKSVLTYNPQRILDIGCGNGYLCQIISEKGVECIGIDPVNDAIEYARKNAPLAEFFPLSCYENFTEINLGKFDLITCTEVIEHLYLPKTLVEFAKKHLNHHGIFIITTPDYGSYWRNLFISLTNRWDKHHTPLWDGGHIKFWSKNTLSKLLLDKGFSIEKWEGVRSIRVPVFNMTIICHARLIDNNE